MVGKEGVVGMIREDRDLFREVVLLSTGLPDKPTYSISEVCRMFGISRITLEKYIKSEVINLPVYRFTSHMRIYRSDLERVFNSSSVYSWDSSDVTTSD